MASYLEHAREIAASLGGVKGVRVVPDPPQTPMMHILIATTQERFAAAARTLAAERGVWTWPASVPTSDPAVQRVELAVGDATCQLPATEIAALLGTLASAG